MVTAQPIANEAPGANEELIELLRQANSSLGLLRESAEHVVALEDSVALGFCPKQMRTLCGIIDTGRGRIQRRLAILVGAGEAQAADPDSLVTIADPAAFLASYRACCRHLCRALNEARRIPNAAAGAMLSDLVLRLEKQLWLMDTPGHDRGSDRYRSVSIFLTC